MKKQINRYNKNSQKLSHNNEKNKGNNLLKQENFDDRQSKLIQKAKEEKLSPVCMSGIDDLDQMILHEDFGYYLFLASQLKKMHNFFKKRQSLTVDDNINIDNIMENINQFDSEDQQVNITKKIIRDRLCNYKRASIPSTLVLKKGLFPQTDSLMNESINVIQQKIKKCYNEIKGDNESDDLKRRSKKIKTGKGALPAQPIAVKYSKHQTDILTNWMIQHREHPFPDSNEVKKLAKETNLAYNQVVNWTTNVRKRNMKATIEGGKKPHHFLDFLFLTQERERKAGEHQQEQKHTLDNINMQTYNFNEHKMPQKVKSKRRNLRKKGKNKNSEILSSPHLSDTNSTFGNFSIPQAQMLSQNVEDPGRYQMSSFDTFTEKEAPVKAPLLASNGSFASSNSAFTAYVAPASSISSNYNNPMVTPVYTQQRLSIDQLHSQTAFMPMQNKNSSNNNKRYKAINNDIESKSSTYLKVPFMPPLSPIVSTQAKLQLQPDASSWDTVVRSVKSPDLSTRRQKRPRAHSFDDGDDDDDDGFMSYQEGDSHTKTPPNIFLNELNLEDTMHDSHCFESKKKQAMDLFWNLTSFTLDDGTATASQTKNNIEKLGSTTSMDLKNKCNNLLNELKSEMVTTTVQLDDNTNPSIVNNVTFEEITPKAPDASKRNSLDSYDLCETFLKDLDNDDLLF